MTSIVRKGLLPALALAVALVMAVGALPQSAYAAVSAVYTATVTPSYANPATGQIEDAGGSSNQALGESMVTSTTKTEALVETDTEGNTFVTLRIGLIDQITGVSVECSTDGGSTFDAVDVAEMQRDVSHGEASPDNTGDFRFQAPSPDSVMRVKLDVIPMGREVIYFVSLSNLVEGNSAGFVQTVTPGEGEPDDAAADAAADGSDEASDQGAQQDADAAVGNDSSASGVAEFDADGNEVTDDSNVKPLDGAQVATIVGVVAAVAIVAGVVVYAAYVRPKRARQAAAAAAASAPAKDKGKGKDA